MTRVQLNTTTCVAVLLALVLTLLESYTNALVTPLRWSLGCTPPRGASGKVSPLLFAGTPSRREAVFSTMMVGGFSLSVALLVPMWLDPCCSSLVAAAFAAVAPSTNEGTRSTVRVTLDSPGDVLGLELVEAAIGTPQRTVLAIRTVRPMSSSSRAQGLSLFPGMVCRDFSSLRDLKERVQSGPYPVVLDFENLAAGGDALSDFGSPLVSPQNALDLARKQAGTTAADPERTIGALPSGTYEVSVLRPPIEAACRSIRSRRGDVLELEYAAQFHGAGDGRLIEYDSSASRGTGQPYQMVLGSGDVLPGVDLGLYDMCPGEVRRLRIPTRLAYGSRGNRLLGIPPNADLEWTVELVAVNSLRADSETTRDDLEGRVR